MKHTKALAFAVALLMLAACQALTPSGVEGSRAAGGETASTAQASPESAAKATATASRPTRPRLAFAGTGGLWIANPDGSFLQQVTSLDLSQTDLVPAVSPNGDRLAVVVQRDQGLDLILVSIPGGETQTLAHLIDITQDDLASNPTGSRAVAYYAISKYNSVAWQPGEGRYLAFMGDIQGPSSDLYVYDSTDGTITQLTDGPSQAILPSWSPDGQYILHYGVSWTPPFGGAIVGYNRLDGAWAARISDQEVITQPKPKGQYANIAGWLDDEHYIIYDSGDTSGDLPACAYSNLRSVEVASGKSAPIMEWDFNGLAFLPTNKGFIFDSKSGCQHSPGQGTFLLLPGQEAPTRLMDDLPYEYHWLPEGSFVQAYPQSVFSPDSKPRYDAPVPTFSFKPAISKQAYAAWELIQNQQGSVVVNVGGAEWKPIFEGFVDQLMWDPIEGRTLFIAAHDGKLYRGSAPEFVMESLGEIGHVGQAMWMP